MNLLDLKFDERSEPTFSLGSRSKLCQESCYYLVDLGLAFGLLDP